MAVIYSHCLTNGLRPGSIWANLAVHGHNGVNVFFAISGFLICGKLLQELKESQTISLRSFYTRRAFRILPPVCAYLLALLILAKVGWIETQGWELISTLFFIRNYFPIMHGQEIGVHTSQFWSLAVEEHFYMIWPVLLLMMGPRMRRIGCVSLACAILVFVWRSIDSASGWFTPFGTNTMLKTDTRIDGLMWGCLAAVVYPYIHKRLAQSRLRRTIWIPVLLAVLIAALAKSVPGISLFRAILFPVLIMSTAIAPDSQLGRLLELPFMKWVGRISYSLYIWQQLFVIPVTISTSPVKWLQHFPYNLVLLFIPASISYYFLEQPLIHLGRRLAASGRPSPRAGTPVQAIA
jgi:peptidoglycan/LPS O-acetylase OafA/YrhL